MPRHPGFSRLVDELSPGGRLRSVSRLKGGLGAQMHVLDIEAADGPRRKVTLRRLIPGYDDGTAEGARAGFERLLLVEKAGIPAPRPLLLDAEGEYFGVPAIVLTYIPGESRYQPADTSPWTADLAEALYRIHQVTPDRFDLSPLPRFLKEEIPAELGLFAERARVSDDPLVREAQAALWQHLDGLVTQQPCLIHGDFWPGNTVWHRGRLAAVIDWTDAKLGDRRSDIAQCQMELSFTLGLDVGDALVADYERNAGPQPGLWYFQLLWGLVGLVHVDRWLDGYSDAGVQLDATEVRSRLNDFVKRALVQAEMSGP